MNKNKTLWVIIVAAVVIVSSVVLANKYLSKPGDGTGVNSGYTSPTPVSIATSTTPTGVATTSRPLSVSVKATSTSGSGVTVSFQKFYQGDSFSFSYPATWTIFNPAPFSINNFKGEYDLSGAVPVGGAEIDVATTTLYSGRLGDIMGTELLSATNVTTSTVTVQGISCIEARYSNTYGGGIASQNAAVYCVRGAGLWKLYLSYRAGDAKGEDLARVFSGVLASFKFLP